MHVEAAIAQRILHQEKSILRSARKGYSYCGFALRGAGEIDRFRVIAQVVTDGSPIVRPEPRQTYCVKSLCRCLRRTVHYSRSLRYSDGDQTGWSIGIVRLFSEQLCLVTDCGRIAAYPDVTPSLPGKVRIAGYLTPTV